jgi:hypothetical protein
MMSSAARDEAIKSGAIADQAERFGITSAQAAALDQAGRDALAGLAGQRPPSPTTWALVVERLVMREHPLADPFEGLPQ